MSPLVTGWRCAVCGATLDIAESQPWRCPRSTADDVHHVLHIVSDSCTAASEIADEGRSPFVVHDRRLAWAAHADVHGLDANGRAQLVDTLDEAVAAVDGTGFRRTPFRRSPQLSDALGFHADGGVWVKDETGNVAGSHKARHLFTILLHLLAVERLGLLAGGDRPPLAIASCGNAALAAATLARAADWPIDVFVPTWMSDDVGARLDALDAHVHRCERRVADPAGDPAMFRFREAVAAGAVPFTVQGTENALCLDGGRTIGWEIGAAISSTDGPQHIDRVVAQVGGGAFAACLGRGLAEVGHPAPLVPVQAEGCAPFARAWRRAGRRASVAELGARWDELMAPWSDPTSVADGILDDETYDWLAVADVLGRSGGEPVVVSDALIAQAHRLALGAGFDASPTGAAGLAGVLATRAEIGDGERVAVVMTGVGHVRQGRRG